MIASPRRLASSPDVPARRASPRRWARCCGGPAFSPNIKERADCSRRAVHRRRRAARAGRAHPRAPRLDAGVGGGAVDRFAGDRSARRAGRPQRPVRRRHPPQRHHRRRAVLRRRRLVGWVANRAHHADVGGAAPGLDAGRRHRDRAGGPAHPAGAARPPRCAACCVADSRTPDERAGDLDAQVGANRRRRAPAARARSAARGSPLDEVLDYGERRMRAALADAARRHVDVRRRARLDRPASRPAAAGARSRVAVTRRRRRRHVRLHRHRRAAARQRQRGRSGDGERGGVRAAVRRPTRRSRPTAARCGRCTVIAPPGTIVAARAAGGGRRRQRRGEPARRRRVPRRAGPGACPARVGARQPGHDEQRAHRRARRTVGVLRDRRRRAGRPPGRRAAA